MQATPRRCVNLYWNLRSLAQTASLRKHHNMLDSTAGWAANAALTGITLIPLGTFWVLDLQKRVQHQSQPSRLAQGFLRAALPVLMV